MKALRYVLFFVFVFSVGVYSVYSSRNKFQKPSAMKSSTSRDPAAIRPNFDFSKMEGSNLLAAAKERLITGSRFISKKGTVGVELGHFVLRGPSGQKIFACEEYSKISLTFEGDGTMIDGHKPSMTVEGHCSISQTDVNRISPIWIPAQQILAEQVQEGDFEHSNKESVKVYFQHVYDEWPKQWAMKSVSLSRDGSDPLIVSEEELNQIHPEPVILDFSALHQSM